MTYEERRKQIRQREEEIVELMALTVMGSTARESIILRIIAQLESALADLKHGMRTAAPDGARSDAND